MPEGQTPGWTHLHGNSIWSVRLAKLNCIILCLLCCQTLEYCSTYVTHSRKLENVKKLAAKISTRKWDSSYQQLLPELCCTLAERRKRQKLVLCFCIVKGLSLIPPSFFIPHFLLNSGITIPILYTTLCVIHKLSNSRKEF